MKKLGKITGLVALIAVVGVFTACEEVDYSDVVVQFVSLTANGGGNETSTELYLVLNKAVEGLNIADITLSNISVSKVNFSEEPEEVGGNYKYTLAVDGLSVAGTVIVTVEKQGFKFEGSPKSTRLFYRVPVDFQGVEDNGTAVLTTTQLFLTFDRVVPDLNKEDITLAGGPAGLVKGELSEPRGSGPVVYTLDISGLNRPGPYQVIVSVSKEGFGFLPSSRSVSIDFYSPPINFMRVEADGNATTMSKELYLTFDQEITSLSVDEITLDGIPGVVKGALTGARTESGDYKYTLQISSFTESGILSVSVAKTGVAITNSTRTTTVYFTNSIEFLNLIANSDANGTTINIVLYFDNPFDRLSSSDIELSGVNGVIKGDLDPNGAQYTLPISGFTTSGSLKVTVSRAGYTIKNPEKSVNITYADPAFETVADFEKWLNGMRTNNASTPYTVTLKTLSDLGPPALSVKQVLTAAGSSNKYVIIELDSASSYTIGAEAFKGCTTLVSINLKGASVTLSYSVFSGCTSLTSVTIGAGVMGIGDTVFADCVNLATISVDKENTLYSSFTTFDEDGVDTGVLYNKDKSMLIAYPPAKAVTPAGTPFLIPTSVRTIYKFAFSGSTRLQYVTIPDSVTTIGDAAFMGCTGLGSVTIPNSLDRIGKEVFAGCTGLSEVVFAGTATAPSIVATIGEAAFKNTRLASVTIPISVVEIGKQAFADCANLTGIVFAAGTAEEHSQVATIGIEAFMGCTRLNDVTIPASVTNIRESAFSGCSGLNKISITETEGSGLSIGNKAFSGSGLTSAELPNSVTSLGDEVFSGCNSLTTITIGNRITSIGINTLKGCGSLTDLTIGSGVSSISAGALSVCAKLAKVSVNASNGYYFATDNVLYSKDKEGDTLKDKEDKEGEGDTLVAYPPARTGTFTIPAAVTTIGAFAFKNCTSSSLSTINIPATVEFIEPGAFAACTSLNKITVGGTGLSASAHFYADPETGVLYNFDKDTLIAYPAGKSGAFPIPKSDVEGAVNVVTIENYAFFGGIITGVVIPDSVESIGVMAFDECSRLLSVEFKGTIASGQFASDAFPGDLRSKFYSSITQSGTPGVYRRSSGSPTWSKQ